MSLIDLETSPHVLAEIPYNNREEFVRYGRTVFDQDNPENTTFMPDPRIVPIYDGRQATIAPTLDANGFELRRAPSAVTDFYDREMVERIYYPEVEALIRSVTGARDVLLWGCTVRSSDAGIVMKDAIIPDGEVRDRTRSKPAGAAHIDYTRESAEAYVEDIVGADKAAGLLARPFSQINVWRGLEQVDRAPLAVCDGSTIAPEDLLIAEVRKPVGPKIVDFRTGYHIMFSPRHRWYYYSQMRPDEALLFRLVDSNENNVQRVAHTAFTDPNTPTSAPPRQSIEIRTICFY